MCAKKQKMGIVLLAILTAVILSSTCFAEGNVVKTQGIVNTTRDANEAITSVELASDTGTYNIELDANGLELGEMDGQKVEVEGTVSEKDGQKWLKVAKFSTLE
jgi:methionine-rich copper-binding protein CopC